MIARSKLWTLAFAGAALAAAIATGWIILDRDKAGIPNFYIWRALSGQAHGGQKAQINGIKLYYETFGRGPPVLVLHGGTALLETMHYQITDLATDHLVIAPDSRAHGRSEDGPGPLHYQAMADDMIGLLDHLHIAKVDVVGWSDGGIIGLDLAMRYPGRVRRVVAIGANYDVAGLVSIPAPAKADDPGAAATGQAYRLVSNTPGHWPQVYAKIVQMWRTEPHYSAADLRKIHSPVLIMAGEYDGIRQDHTNSLGHLIPGAKVVILAGASHRGPLEFPDKVNADIRSFLGGDWRAP